VGHNELTSIVNCFVAGGAKDEIEASFSVELAGLRETTGPHDLGAAVDRGTARETEYDLEAAVDRRINGEAHP